jgi:hypothetical protein
MGATAAANPSQPAAASLDPLADLMGGMSMPTASATAAPLSTSSSSGLSGFGSLDPMADLMGCGGGGGGGGGGGAGVQGVINGGGMEAARSNAYDDGAEPTLRVGGTAVIQGLQAKPEFNGKTATLVSFDVSKQRWNINSGGVVLALRAANLTLGSAGQSNALDSFF